MSDAATKTTTSIDAILTTAARAHAARLCKQAMAPIPGIIPTPTQRARAERYQVEEFTMHKAQNERIVADLLLHPAEGEPLVDTREAFLAAVDTYRAAGLAEVRRLFAAAR